MKSLLVLISLLAVVGCGKKVVKECSEAYRGKHCITTTTKGTQTQTIKEDGYKGCMRWVVEKNNKYADCMRDIRDNQEEQL